jgi:hypothetical protein
MSTATPPASTQRRPSFFRRLSLSSGSGSEPVIPGDSKGQDQPPRRSSSRAVSGPVVSRGQDVLAGLPYDALPPGAAPSAYRPDRRGMRSEGESAGVSNSPSATAPRRELVKRLQPPASSHFPPSSVTSSPLEYTPSRSRNPIHPALASPPGSPPRLTSSSPYVPAAKQHRSVNRHVEECAAMPNDIAPSPVNGTSPRSSMVPSQSTTMQVTAFSRPKPISEMSKPVRGLSHQDTSRFEDANVSDTRLPVQGTPQRLVVSARRSTSAGRQRIDVTPSTKGLSAASAYALAVAPALVGRQEPPRSSNSAPPGERRVSRPLPRPPSVVPGGNPHTVHITATSTTAKSSPPRQASAEKPHPRISIPNDDHSTSTPPRVFDFPRSPTLPPLLDPRQSKKVPIGSWPRGVSDAPILSQLPRRTSSATPQSKSISSSFASSVVPAQSLARPRVRRQRQRGESPLLYALSHTSFQAALLPFLSINSFLSLTGSSDVVRKLFSGEIVGRWVCGEWGVQVDRERGRSWPNLTVWEGAREYTTTREQLTTVESLLHDPATYSTYPPQWHNLLQHLCLSHTLIVLFLRSVPTSAFPSNPLPFDEDAGMLPSGPDGNLYVPQRPMSRRGSAIGSDSGSLGNMPRHERLVEIVMPEPLAARPKEEALLSSPPTPLRRRGSIGSIASAASFSFGRKRSNSIASSVAPTGKATLPPVSYPMAKRYGFKQHGETIRSRTSSDSGRPGSVFSMSSSPSIRHQPRISAASVRSAVPPVPTLPQGLVMPRPIGGNQRVSIASSGTSRRSDAGGSPLPGRWGSPALLDSRIEPAFDQSLPYTPGRAPILRVFVPLTEKVRRWPSAEAALAAVRELDKCGATRRLKLGDLVVSRANPKATDK